MAGDLRFYLDVHIPAAVRAWLRRRDIDVLPGHLGAGESAADEEIWR